MKRVAVFVLMLAATIGLAAPAHAGKPVKTTSSSSSANAFWYSVEELGGGAFRETVWYIGAYVDDYGTFSDLYRATTTCRRTRCSSEYAFGYSDSAVLTMAEDLSVAHIEGSYLLESFDDRRRSTGTTEAVYAVVDFEGAGDLETNGGSYSYRDEFISIRGTFDDAFRPAEAYGSVNGTSLGETYDAYMSSSTSTTVERSR